MAFTKLINDPCATKKRVEESTSVLTYLMDPTKYYNCNPCFIERGTVGGNTASIYDGNIVDLESDLSGRTRAATHCPSGKYLPGTIVQNRDAYAGGSKCDTGGYPYGNVECRKNNLLHLPTCQIVQYQPRPTTVGYDLNYPPCGTFGKQPVKTRKTKTVKRTGPSSGKYQDQQGVKQWPRY